MIQPENQECIQENLLKLLGESVMAGLRESKAVEQVNDQMSCGNQPITNTLLTVNQYTSCYHC